MCKVTAHTACQMVHVKCDTDILHQRYILHYVLWSIYLAVDYNQTAKLKFRDFCLFELYRRL